MVFCEESDSWARNWENNVFCSCCCARVLPQNASFRHIRGATLGLGDKKIKMGKFSERGWGVGVRCGPRRGRLGCPSEGVRGLS